MLYVAPLDKPFIAQANDLAHLESDNLDVCPEKAKAAEFLRLMDGWL